jgi:hypothetical protein
MDPVSLAENGATLRLLEARGRWVKVRVQLRDTGLWAGDSTLLASLRADLFWAQPVQSGELTGASTKTCRHSIKIRTIASHNTVSNRDSDDISERLEREMRILQGAMQLRDAARSPEQQALAQAHISASERTIAQLKAGNIPDPTEHTFLPNARLDDNNTCDACFLPGPTHCCPECDAVVHAECQERLAIGCNDASDLKSIIPVYLQAGSSQEVRRWLCALEAARDQILST